MRYSENTAKYRFRDTDDTGWDEYDIEGEDYRELIDTCCQYCSIVSFDIYPQYEDAEYLIQIQKYMIKREDTYRVVSEEFGSYITGTDKRYYRVCSEMSDLLKKEKNIFSWLWEENNPFHFENLTFYREDGTVFFESITHEGECYLYAKETEDVSKIVSNQLWEKNPKPPLQFDLTPKNEEWVLEYNKELERVRIEKYNQDLKLAKEKLETTDCWNKLALQSCPDIMKIADKFGFHIDKVIDDIFALQY
ncbi:MAG: hypothetical protein IJD19_01585 [Ruminococcus sp.]|nr:hypothetical protein [Ruminococcus sp.]